MVEEYSGALSLREGRPELTTAEVVRAHSAGVRWDQALKDNLVRRKAVAYRPENIRATLYRPFVRQHCYVEYVLANRKYQMDRIFPGGAGKNRAICVPGVGSTKPFSALVVDSMPDLHFVAFGQCLPRYEYPVPGSLQGKLTDRAGSGPIDNVHGRLSVGIPQSLWRRCHHEGRALRLRLRHLPRPGVPAQFANDLAKALPSRPHSLPTSTRSPKPGTNSLELHLGYESCDEYPLELVFAGEGGPGPEHFRLGAKAMRFTGAERSVLAVNDFVSLAGVPAEAHEYEVNGRTPLEWFIDRYKVKQDKRSGIVN